MKSLIVANWKMNPATFREAKKLFEATKKAADKFPRASVIVAPPSIFLREFSSTYKGRKLSFAAQNAHYEHGGAHTGEISVLQVKDAKAHYLIVGHAERRASGETDDDVGKKVAAALTIGLSVILCVGERERSKAGEYFAFVRRQLLAALADAPAAKLSRIVIAYEPVWAIGAAQPMNPRDMHEMSIFIRKTLVEKFGDAGMKTKVLYGGSIDPTNAADMMRYGEVQGLLVGRASTDGAKFSELLGSVSVL